MSRSIRAAIVCTILLSLAASAHAHRLHLFAETDGRTITGQAYAGGGHPIAGATVRISNPETAELFGEVETDAEGAFSWRLTHRCEHLLSLTVDGHAASQRIAAEHIDPALSALPTDTATALPQTPLPDSYPEGESPPSAMSEADDVRQAVAGEIAPLQRQIRDLSRRIDHYESRVRLHDILGGLGYIAGLAALALFCTRSKSPRKT